MACILCSAAAGNAANDIDVVAYGFSASLPLGICQSFGAFQQWFLVNSPVTVPGADQGGWTDLMAGAGVTMGN